MELIVELISRSKKTLERHSFDKTHITIGRAYDNDLIVSEPHICPHHALLRKDSADDDSWVLCDLDSQNGTYNEKGHRISGAIELNSGDEFRTGKMHFRLFNPNHPVKPTIELSVLENIFNILSQPSLALLLTFIILIVTAYGKYLQSYSKINNGELGISILGFFMMILIWASLWAFIGKLIRHEPRFITQFIISGCVFFFFSINEYISALVAFNTLSFFWIYAYDYLSNGLLLVLLFALNLRFSIQQSSWKRGIFANTFAWSVIGALMLFQISEDSDFKASPVYVQTLLPNVLLWVKPVTSETFIANAESIFEQNIE